MENNQVMQEQLIGEGGKRAEEHDRVKHSVTTCCPMEKEHTA